MENRTQAFKQFVQRFTVIDWIVLVVICAVILALIIPKTKWASSGSLQVPVKIMVFDLSTGSPIPHAQVTLFRAPPVHGLQAFLEDHDRYRPAHYKGFVHELQRGETDLQGSATIGYEFRTGANYENPAPRAHTNWVWVEVRAAGYGVVVVPIRHESLATSGIKERGELAVPIGLEPAL